MIAKTPQGKDMRKYYVKLENINNKVVSFQMEEQKQLLIEQNENTVKLLEEKDGEHEAKIQLNRHNILFKIK